MKKIKFIALFIIFFYSCKQEQKKIVATNVTNLPFFNSANFTPEWNVATHKIPAFSFTNQLGNTITNATYKGKIYIANFFFTICPGICPKLTNNMILLQKHYADDTNVMLLSHSVMPWYDTVKVLSNYAKTNRIDNLKWNLVTGNKDSIYAIARKGYFADEDFGKTQEENNFIHTENFILIDKKGHIRGVYNGTIEMDLKRLIRHIDILKKEK
ncbi:SCO family protein [uncultured Maribacter sp.]|uniref:SCO family protein n=1 Tax=uncultured Maribacter sp. TaxID=431308 RepID=UPI0026315952|nr:SCO family protein [uncultured Maribacter sp.]